MYAAVAVSVVGEQLYTGAVVLLASRVRNIVQKVGEAWAELGCVQRGCRTALWTCDVVAVDGSSPEGYAVLHAAQDTVPDIAALAYGETTLDACWPSELRPTRLPVPTAVWDVLGERRRENKSVADYFPEEAANTHSSRCYRACPRFRCTCPCIP